jgi:hypothetical protein
MLDRVEFAAGTEDVTPARLLQNLILAAIISGNLLTISAIGVKQ